MLTTKMKMPQPQLYKYQEAVVTHVYLFTPIPWVASDRVHYGTTCGVIVMNYSVVHRRMCKLDQVSPTEVMA